eukprot:476917-Lingulodinium_polyedra.AAC.1
MGNDSWDPVLLKYQVEIQVRKERKKAHGQSKTAHQPDPRTIKQQAFLRGEGASVAPCWRRAKKAAGLSRQ